MTSNKINLSFLLILSALMGFTSLSTDVYLPAMPTMEKELGGSAEYTITGFLVGFAIAQLIWGPISDRIGRKIPLYIGMVLFTIGSVGCAMSDSMESIVFWRVFQALGACIGPMLSRAMIRDLFSSTRAAQMLSTLVIIMAIAPIAGPFIGGMLLKASSWHAIFWLLAAIGVMMFFSIFKLPETLRQEKRSTGSVLSSFANYGKLFGNKTFTLYTLSVTFFYVAIYAFIAGSPAVYLNHFGIDTQYYGVLYGINIVGVVALSFVNRKLVARFKLPVLLFRASLIAFAFTLVLLFLGWNDLFLEWGIIVPMFFVFGMNGIIAATANAAALDRVPSSLAGSAAALLGALQYGSGIISSILLALFADDSPKAMVLIIAVFAGLCTLMSFWAKKD